MKVLLISFLAIFSLGFGFILATEDNVKADVASVNKVGYACYSFVDDFTNLWTDENVADFDKNLDSLISETENQIIKLEDEYAKNNSDVILQQQKLLTEANTLLKEIQANPNDEDLKYKNRLLIEDMITQYSMFSQDVAKSNEGCY